MNVASLPEIIRKAARTFRLCFPDLLAFWLVLTALFSVVLGPLLGWIFNVLLVSRGVLYLSNEQVVAFLGRPSGWLSLVAVGTLALASVFAHLAGMILIASGAREAVRMRPARVLRALAKDLTGLIGLGFRQLLLYGLSVVPVLAVGGLIYFGLLARHDINYYLVWKPREFWVAAILLSVMAAGFVSWVALLYVRWSLSLPSLLFDGHRGFAALRESQRLVKGEFARVAGPVLGWPLFVSAVAATAALGIHFLGEQALGVFGTRIGSAVAIVSLVLMLDFFASVASSFMGLAGSALLIMQLDVDLRARKGLAPRATGAPSPLIRDERARSPARRRWAPWLVAVPAFLISVGLTVSLIEEERLEDHVKITAHRGSSRRAPENTLSAVRAAIEDGADYAEIDVQETADGVVVVLHDSDFMRTTGNELKIWEIGYSELEKLDVGSWFSEKFRGEKVPRLADVMAVAADEIQLNIELKFNGYDQELVERTLRVIHDHDFKSKCVVTSLDYGAVVEAKRRDPELKVGHVVYQAVGDISKKEVDFLSVSRQLVTRDLVSSAHAQGKDVHVWTVNDVRDMSRMIDWGVDNIITDVPAQLVRLLEERSKLSDLERFLLKAKTLLLE